MILGKVLQPLEDLKLRLKFPKKAIETEKAQILFKLINFYNSKNILEIALLGLTTYLSNANKNSSVTNLEETQYLFTAKKNFKIRFKNVTLHHGDFDNLLPKIFTQKFDFFF